MLHSKPGDVFHILCGVCVEGLGGLAGDLFFLSRWGWGRWPGAVRSYDFAAYEPLQGAIAPRTARFAVTMQAGVAALGALLRRVRPLSRLRSSCAASSTCSLPISAPPPPSFVWKVVQRPAARSLLCGSTYLVPVVVASRYLPEFRAFKESTSATFFQVRWASVCHLPQRMHTHPHSPLLPELDRAVVRRSLCLRQCYCFCCQRTKLLRDAPCCPALCHA